MEKLIKQFIKFGCVGVSNTIISYVVYLIGIKIGLHYLIASISGFFLSVVNAYYWNSKYVFKSQELNIPQYKVFLKTLCSYAGTGLILSNVLLIVFIDGIGMAEWLAPLLVNAINIPLNFLLNKFWANK